MEIKTSDAPLMLFAKPKRAPFSENAMRFGIKIIWWEPINHVDDFCFCSMSAAGINKKKQKSLNDPNFTSAIQSVPHSDKLPVPVFKDLPDIPVESLDHCPYKVGC